MNNYILTFYAFFHILTEKQPIIQRAFPLYILFIFEAKQSCAKAPES
uniref:Uncharacterized protein n=1 Tax=Anguilla anguilla TaxID=7936 RepID=A0A0E9RP75_ANGAN